MEHGNAFLQNLALVLSVAAVTTIVSQRLRQPLVFGYLLAGMIVGPHLPVPLLADQDMLRQLAELGVVLLMFALGLEFSVRKLAALAPTSGVAALAETSVMLWLGFAVGKLMGWSAMESLYLGGIVCISSTTIIAKAYAERGVSGPVRPVVFGILVFEDLVAILLVAGLTAMSGDGLSLSNLGATAIRLAGFLAALLGIGLWVVPRLVRFVAVFGKSETLLVTSIGICFGAALLALAFGYSVALGAFIAGSLVGESGDRTRIEHLIVPVRDVFVAIFFVSVGTLIDPRTIGEHWRLVLGLVALVTFGKVIAVSIAAFLTGSTPRTAVQAGMSLAQIGEFSFIIAAVGAASGTTRPYLYPVAVAVSAITTFMTPWLIRGAGPVALYTDRKLPKALQTYVTLYGSWIERMREATPEPEGRRKKKRYVRLLALDGALLILIIVATSLELPRVSGMLVSATGITPGLARVLVVAAATAFGAPVLYGVMNTARFLAISLATQALPVTPDNRVDMAAAPRGMLVVTLQLGIVMLVLVPILAITQPLLTPLPGAVALVVVLGLLLIAFWRSARNLYGHARAGAEVIVGALSRQMAATEELPEDMTRTMEFMRVTLPGLGEPVPIRVTAGSPSVNRRLAEINLRGHTGATILAIGREGEPVIAPTGSEVLREGDVLAVAGTHEAISAAIELLGGLQGAARRTVSGIPSVAGI
jgi:CPA2 family monovalent cation:H+ antiporter-2